MENKVRVGIIGVGSISEVHITGYKNDPRAEIVAFCDINEKLLKEKGEKHGVKNLYTDVNEMLKNEKLDAVSVCTWNAAHAPCTIAALNAGVNVLCEKPMAMNVEEANAMREAAERNGKLLMIGFVRRFGNDCAVIKDFINEGYFGDFYYAKATYLRRNGCPGGWFGEKAKSGGGPLIDLGVHVIDLVRYIMGNPKPVSVYGATFNKLGDRPGVKKSADAYASSTDNNSVFDVEDLASAMIRFDNGAVLHIEASFSLNIEKDEGKIELFGTKAGAKIDPEITLYSETAGYMTDTTIATGTALSFNGLFDNETSHFISCVTGEIKECRAPAEDGITLMTILGSIYESARTGHEVTIA